MTLLLAAAGCTFAAAQPRSISASRQFIVYGSEVAVRGAVCALAESTKSNLLRLLDLRDSWKTPVVINLDYPKANFPEAPLVQLEVSQMGFGLKLQLNLLLTGDLEGGTLQRELLRAILIEMMYRARGDIVAGTPYVAPPDWLVDGVLELAPGHDCEDNVELLQTVVAAQQIAPLADVVRQEGARLDVPSRKIYAAYSMSLLQMLIESPDGRGRLARLISDLPEAPNEPVADLAAHFPAILGRSAEKWWALSVAQLSAADRHATLSAAATAARLDQLLRLSIPAPDGRRRNYSLGEYAIFLKLPAHTAVLRQVSQRLLLLGAQAHPAWRAIVQEDYELVELLARGKQRHISQRLARLASYRQTIEQQASAMDDYLNWFEATQLKSMSGAFVKILRETSASAGAQPPRRDPISLYLDEIEMEMN